MSLRQFLRRVFSPWGFEILLPDGCAETGSVLYKGEPLRVTEVHLDVVAGGKTELTLVVHPIHMRAVLKKMNIAIEGLKAADRYPEVNIDNTA